MSIYTPVPLDVNRKFNFYDKIFEVKAVVEIVNFTPVSNRDGSYYFAVATKPASYDHKPDTTVVELPQFDGHLQLENIEEGLSAVSGTHF